MNSTTVSSNSDDNIKKIHRPSDPGTPSGVQQNTPKQTENPVPTSRELPPIDNNILFDSLSDRL